MQKYTPEIHKRRSVRLKNYDYSREGLYFVTICCQDKEHLFGKIIDGEMILNDIGKIVKHCWVPHSYLSKVKFRTLLLI